MPDQRKFIALFPGTFDPVTCGHLDIVERASQMYVRLIVAIGDNPDKRAVFSLEERLDMVRLHTGHLDNVEAHTYSGLTVRFAQEKGAGVIIRGIRDNSDLRVELQLANTNLMIAGIETVFLMTSTQHALTSSTLIKQIVQIGGYDREGMSRLVPLDVADRLAAKYGQPPIS